MQTRFILLIGGSGFIGRHLISQLTTAGYRVVVATRRFKHAQDLTVNSTVDAVVEADVHDDASLDRLMIGMDAVINLVGVLHSRPASKGQAYGLDFKRAHVDLPRRIVAACAARGVSRYLHMSAMGAAEQAPSMYLRSKFAGEREAFKNPRVATTAFRPSVVFGAEDQFLNMFASMQKVLPVIPLAGAQAKFQPVYVGDVAQAFVRALQQDHTIGQRYDLGGPRIYTLRELVQLAGAYSGHPRSVIGLPDSLARMQAWFFERLPGTPILSRDNLDSMRVDSITTTNMWPELGLVPTELEAIAPFYLAPKTTLNAS